MINEKAATWTCANTWTSTDPVDFFRWSTGKNSLSRIFAVTVSITADLRSASLPLSMTRPAEIIGALQSLAAEGAVNADVVAISTIAPSRTPGTLLEPASSSKVILRNLFLEFGLFSVSQTSHVTDHEVLPDLIAAFTRAEELVLTF